MSRPLTQLPNDGCDPEFLRIVKEMYGGGRNVSLTDINKALDAYMDIRIEKRLKELGLLK